MKCQVQGNCTQTPQIHLISACITPHLNETTTCQTHLEVITQMYHQNKLWCHCGKPIITALYKHGQAVRNLNEEPPWTSPKST